MAEYIIDIILAGIFIVMTAVYFKRGFAKTILKFVSFFLSIVLSRIVSGDVTQWVFENTSLFTGTERYHFCGSFCCTQCTCNACE